MKVPECCNRARVLGISLWINVIMSKHSTVCKHHKSSICIKNWAKNVRGGLISWSRWHRKSLAIPPRCASPAGIRGEARFATTCAMATTQSLVAQRRDGPFASGLETFRARRPLTLAREETTHTAHPREKRRARPLTRERR